MLRPIIIFSVFTQFQGMGIVLIYVLLMSKPHLEKVHCMPVAAWGWQAHGAPEPGTEAPCVTLLRYIQHISALSLFFYLISFPTPGLCLVQMQIIFQWLITTMNANGTQSLLPLFQKQLRVNNFSQFVYSTCLFWWRKNSPGANGLILSYNRVWFK